MKSLMKNTNRLIDSIYSKMLKDPEATLDSFTDSLTYIGINGGSEEVLSIISGYVLGLVTSAAIVREFNDEQTENYQNEALKTIKKKTAKLREALTKIS